MLLKIKVTNFGSIVDTQELDLQTYNTSNNNNNSVYHINKKYSVWNTIQLHGENGAGKTTLLKAIKLGMNIHKYKAVMCDAALKDKQRNKDNTILEYTLFIYDKIYRYIMEFNLMNQTIVRETLYKDIDNEEILLFNRISGESKNSLSTFTNKRDTIYFHDSCHESNALFVDMLVNMNREDAPEDILNVNYIMKHLVHHTNITNQMLRTYKEHLKSLDLWYDNLNIDNISPATLKIVEILHAILSYNESDLFIIDDCDAYINPKTMLCLFKILDATRKEVNSKQILCITNTLQYFNYNFFSPQQLNFIFKNNNESYIKNLTNYPIDFYETQKTIEQNYLDNNFYKIN